ncbi:MAG: hypothetical protein ABIN61_00445 [candidate division WOR-3 bacterium]
MRKNGLFIISFILILFAMNCKETKIKQNFKEYRYKVIPNEEIEIYGVNVNKAIDEKFSLLEKEFNSKAEIDDEVAVVILRRLKDFVKKTKETIPKDCVDLLYGPIDVQKIYNQEIYKEYQNVSPNTIIVSGKLLFSEDSTVKESIITELQKILPSNDTCKKVIKDLRQFIHGDFEKNTQFKIDFDIPKFPYAEFAVWFHKGEEENIYYQYIFSLREDAYPY